MLPFYFFSVVFNALAGAVFVFIDPKENLDSGESPMLGLDILREKNVLLGLTIVTGIIGIIKLFLPVLNSILVFGDLLPALTGIMSALLFANRYIVVTDGETSVPGFLQMLSHYEKIIGYVCLAVAVLHLLFSQVILF